MLILLKLYSSVFIVFFESVFTIIQTNETKLKNLIFSFISVIHPSVESFNIR